MTPDIAKSSDPARAPTPDWLPPALLDTREILLLAFPGGGCAPAVYERVRCPGVRMQVVDWGRQSGPWQLDAIAARIASAIAPRRGITLLAGHSIGGVIATLVALRSPDRIHGLLLANTGASTRGLGDPDLPHRIATAWTPDAAEAFLRSCFWRQPAEPLWSELTRYLAGIDLALFGEVTASLRATDLRARLSEIRCPVVIAFGRHDRRRTLEHAFDLADGISDSTLMLLPAGHTPMVEAPDHYNDALALLTGKVSRRHRDVT
ncbi:MAG: alpha/beta fold hydrolase [Lautropia sp.]